MPAVKQEKSVKPKSPIKKRIKRGLGFSALGFGAVAASVAIAFETHPTDADIETKLREKFARDGKLAPQTFGSSQVIARDDLPVTISSIPNPHFKPPPVKDKVYRVKIDGVSYELKQVADRGPVYQTSDQRSEFYIGDIDSAIANGGLQGRYNVSHNIDQITRIEFKPGTFIIPNPYPNLSDTLKSDLFTRPDGLEFIGVAGTGYVGEGTRAEDRREGYVYVKGIGVTCNTLDKTPRLRQGYYTDIYGKVHSFELPREGFQEKLDRLIRKPDILAVSMYTFTQSHIQDTVDRPLDKQQRYRGSYIVFNPRRELLGAIFTSESETEGDRQKQIREAFGPGAYGLKGDGDFYSKWYIPGIDAPHSSEIALSFENSPLIVRKRDPNGTQDYSDLLKRYWVARSVVDEHMVTDLIKDSHNRRKVETRLAEALPDPLDWLAPPLAGWGVDNPRFRGIVLGLALKKKGIEY